MELTSDDLAGVVDVVGPLTRGELERACGELAFKQGEDADATAFESAIERALTGYQLLSVDDHDADATGPLIVVGPAAFPTFPDGVADLPHILDVPERELDREAMATAAERRFREDAAAAASVGDEGRIAELLDVSYDLEAWGPVELGAARDRLDDA